MKVLVLDGSSQGDAAGVRIRTALEAELARRGHCFDTVTVREMKIAPCCGEFNCWLRTPGVCIMNDDNRAIARAMMAADLLVYLTPVTFGGYSSILKRFIDHQIQNITPFFAKIDGEVHHVPRYAKYPDLLAVGWGAVGDPEAASLFRRVVSRNAINLNAGARVPVVVDPDLPGPGLEAAARGWLDALKPVRRALLLVGSPRNDASVSNSLGSSLLGATGAGETETIHLHKAVRGAEGVNDLLRAVDAADLVLLSFPLYVDTLPAPVLQAMELIAAHRAGRTPDGKRFAAIANCGFPEAAHNEVALEICGHFAREAGFAWAGALSMGGGPMLGGKPLEETGGRGITARKALGMAGEALGRGDPIPLEAIRLLARPTIPPGLYTVLGAMGWKRQARRLRTRDSLKNAPYGKGAADAKRH